MKMASYEGHVPPNGEERVVESHDFCDGAVIGRFHIAQRQSLSVQKQIL